MRLYVLALALALSGVCSSQAQGLQAVRPMPGYACMMLSAPPAETVQAIRQVPVRQAPSFTAPILSVSPTVVLVSDPAVVSDGFLRATFADRHVGWIQVSALKPWSSASNPSRRCVPSVMSNGSLGFDFH